MSGKGKHWDKGLFLMTLFLVIGGLVMIYSSSTVMAAKRYGDSFFFFKQQLLWATLGVLALTVTASIPYHWWKRSVIPLTVLTLVLLGLVLVPSLGLEVKGARRWLTVGPISFQPSELAKLVLILYLARYLVKHKEKIGQWREGICFPIFFVGLFIFLLLSEPDLGGAVVMGAVAISLLFVGGAQVKHLMILGIGLIPLMYSLILKSPYRMERISVYLNPWKDPSDSGFQMVQSFLSLGSGGPFGVGLGAGKQKLFYLPESHTDFIFAVVGEELGFLGGLILIGCFLFLIWRGIQIALKVGDPFGTYMGFGITLMIGLQTLVNMGVVTGLLPTKGLPLPLISYGGSSLLVSLTGIGMLLALSKEPGMFRKTQGDVVGRRVAKSRRG